MAEEDQGSSGCRAPSLILWYCDDFEGDILTQDVLVPPEGLTRYTYYCCLQWNGGENGGGYCGIQDHPDGRNYIYSIWDPTGTQEPIRPVFQGLGTKCERFGGEGTGLKSWNFKLGWEPGVWYRLVSRCWQQNNHTFFGCWVQNRTTHKWTHIVTVDFPLPRITFRPSTACFLEDWMGSGKNMRRVQYRNGFKRDLGGKWHCLEKACFKINKEESSRKYACNVNAGCCGENAFFMESGGSTCTSEGICSGSVLKTEATKSPVDGDLSCTLKLTATKLTWELTEDSMPQFRYTVRGDGSVLGSGIDSETREISLPEQSSASGVTLELEDIFGRIKEFSSS